MNSALTQKYHDSLPETLAIFDIRLPGASERLYRERATWEDDVKLEALDRYHFVLTVRAVGARGLTA